MLPSSTHSTLVVKLLKDRKKYNLSPIAATSTASIAEAKRFMQKGRMVVLVAKWNNRKYYLATLIQNWLLRLFKDFYKLNIVADYCYQHCQYS
jgi:hypothetical protein